MTFVVGDTAMARALALGTIGPYQLQAAIESVHNRRAATGVTDWNAISALYDGLQQIAPSLGGAVARASAHLHARRPDVARAVLTELDRAAAERYQPYWVTLAELAVTAGDTDGAEQAWVRALELTADSGVADHLRRRRAGGEEP